MNFRARNARTRTLAIGLALTGLAHTHAAAAPDRGPALSYDDYAKVLSTYCNDRGMVNYRGLKAKRQPLDRFIASVGSLSRKTYDAWPQKDKIAFWVNLYNAFTLQAIIDHYPIKGSWLSRKRFGKQSIRHIPGVWDKLEFRALRRQITLNDIEHEVLRKEFNEPRIHFGLVCASIGCPKLRGEPYLGEKLDAQLDDQVKVFLAAPSKFRIDRGEERVHLSKIFRWFGSDFVESYGTDAKFARQSQSVRAVLSFASRYLSPQDRSYLERGKYGVSYLDYDWSLNEQ